jgi:glycosyltransferase involved in cell wall biosynthesis
MTINVLWAIDHVCYDGSLHGGGRLYWNLLPRFDSRRVRITACLLRASPEIRRVFADSPFPVRILDKAKFDPTTLVSFLRLIRDEQIDVMHLHCYAASTFGRMAGVIANVPTVIHDYDTEVYFDYPWYLSVADWCLAPTTRRAIAASPMVRTFQMAKRSIDKERIETMFHAIPPEGFSSEAPESIHAMRQMLGATPDTQIVGTVTKLGPQRGNEYLIESAPGVLKKHPDTLFVIVYKPTRFHRLPSKKYVRISDAEWAKRGDDLRALARKLGVEDRVRLVEQQTDEHRMLSAFDVFVAPFLSERFSSVHLLEALAAGKPVVGTDLGEQRQIIRDGANGFLVEPKNVDLLTMRISALIRDKGLRERLGRQATLDAWQYSTDAYVRRLEDLYAELAVQDAASASSRTA